MRLNNPGLGAGLDALYGVGVGFLGEEKKGFGDLPPGREYPGRGEVLGLTPLPELGRLGGLTSAGENSYGIGVCGINGERGGLAYASGLYDGCEDGGLG
jgi:hypothetical protein